MLCFLYRLLNEQREQAREDLKGLEETVVRLSDGPITTLTFEVTAVLTLDVCLVTKQSKETAGSLHQCRLTQKQCFVVYLMRMEASQRIKEMLLV